LNNQKKVKYTDVGSNFYYYNFLYSLGLTGVTCICFALDVQLSQQSVVDCGPATGARGGAAVTCFGQAGPTQTCA